MAILEPAQRHAFNQSGSLKLAQIQFAEVLPIGHRLEIGENLQG